jgi:cytochrome P450
MNLLGNGFYALVQSPDQLARLRLQPSLMESAVDEMLRYDAPVQQGTFRFAGEPLAIGGHEMAPGQSVVVALGAANRDPAQFPDAESFDVGRSPNRHLSFGRGIHFCLGAPVARLEARVAWERILARFSRMDLDGSPKRRPNTAFRGFDMLPARFLTGQ